MIYESDITDAMYFLFSWLVVMSFDIGLALILEILL